MQVLFITERFPWPLEDGGNLRTFHILQAISQEHDVTLLCHRPAQDAESAIAELAKRCRVTVVEPPGLLRTSKEILTRPSRWQQPLFILKNWSRPLFHGSPKDWWTMSHLTWSTLTIWTWPRFQHKLDWPFSVFDSHNCISNMAAQLAQDKRSGWMSAIYRRESRKTGQRQKKEVLPTEWLCFCLLPTRPGRVFATGTGRECFMFVPNGVDCAIYANANANKDTQPKQVQRVVFTGAMDYAPNIAGVEWFCRDVFPLVQQRHPRALFSNCRQRPN